MIDKLTEFTDYLRNIPATFLVAIISALGLILFLPEEYAKIVAVDNFRKEYRVYLGPALILMISLCIGRIFTFFMQGYSQKKALKKKQESLHNLTPEEKGYLVPYIIDQRNTVNVGIDDGVMAGLKAKGITYSATNVGHLLHGFPYNLQPWAREYLEQNPYVLNGYDGQPMTPGEKLYS